MIFFRPCEFENQAIFKENLNALDGSQFLLSRIDELDAYMKFHQLGIFLKLKRNSLK
jgi:hypothetical protein